MKIFRGYKLVIVLVLLAAIIIGVNCAENPAEPGDGCAEDERCYLDPDGRYHSLNAESPCPCAEAS